MTIKERIPKTSGEPVPSPATEQGAEVGLGRLHVLVGLIKQHSKAMKTTSADMMWEIEMGAWRRVVWKLSTLFAATVSEISSVSFGLCTFDFLVSGHAPRTLHLPV